MLWNSTQSVSNLPHRRHDSAHLAAQVVRKSSVLKLRFLELSEDKVYTFCFWGVARSVAPECVPKDD
eukprot:612287-Amphidinium_carterae.2